LACESWQTIGGALCLGSMREHGGNPVLGRNFCLRVKSAEGNISSDCSVLGWNYLKNVRFL
jgi:hypothetical protein